MSHQFKKPFLTVLAALAVGASVLLGGAAANAVEPPPPVDCVNDIGGTWSVDWATGAGEVTLEGDYESAPGDTVCDPVALRPTLWHFLEVEKQWNQGNAETNDKVADTIGTTAFQIPGWPATCAQADVYASRVSNGGFDALKLPDELTEEANGQPFEPPYLHSVLEGTGKSYFLTSFEGCNVPVPETVTGAAVFEVLSCLADSKNQATADVVPGGIWSISAGEALTQDLGVVGAGYTGGLPEGLPYETEYTLSLRDGDDSDLFEVTPWTSGGWTPVETVDCAVAPVVTSTPTVPVSDVVQKPAQPMLPSTGTETLPIVWTAALLFLGGISAFITKRRRKAAVQ